MSNNRNTLTKCRVYDKKNRVWVKDPMTVIPGEPIELSGRVIQWWTGVKAKGNIDLYEGDIVKTLDKVTISSMSEDFVIYTRGVITWLREAFCVCQSYVGGNELSNYVSCGCCSCDLEIIGNIFDNPELLDDCPIAKKQTEERRI